MEGSFCGLIENVFRPLTERGEEKYEMFHSVLQMTWPRMETKLSRVKACNFTLSPTRLLLLLHHIYFNILMCISVATQHFTRLIFYHLISTAICNGKSKGVPMQNMKV